MPARIFTAVVMAEARRHQQARDGFPFFAATQLGNASAADKWTRLPTEIWNQVISDIAPLALADCKGDCPFLRQATNRSLR